jgi:hypothetical protein
VNELQSRGINIAVPECKLFHQGQNPPAFVLPSRFATDPDHVHDRSMAQWIVKQKPIDTNEHREGVPLNACRHVGHRQERTKCHLACVVHGFISEDTRSYFRGTSIAADQYITPKRPPVREPCYGISGILRETFKAMVEEYAIWIVSTHGVSQCSVKVDSVNLMVGSTKIFPRNRFAPLLSAPRQFESGG